MTDYIEHPDYEYPLSLASLRIDMQRLVYSFESVKQNIVQVEEELVAVKDDAEFKALNEQELLDFQGEIKRYQASKQALHSLIDYKPEPSCHFDNCNGVATETYKGHDVCEFCYDGLMEDD